MAGDGRYRVGTRRWAIASAIFIIVESIAVIVWFLAGYVLSTKIYSDKNEFKGMAYAGIAIYGTALFTAVLLLGGVFSKIKRLFHPWLVILVMVILFDTGSVSLLTAIHVDFSPNQSIGPWETGGIVFYIFRMAGNIFSYVCVQSYYRNMNNLKDSTNSNARMSLPMRDLSSGEVPPPYSLRDPSANHSPPPYSEVVVNLGHAPMYITGRCEQNNVNASVQDQSHSGDFTECDIFNTTLQQHSVNRYRQGANDPLPLLSQLHTTENFTSSRNPAQISTEGQQVNA